MANQKLSSSSSSGVFGWGADDPPMPRFGPVIFKGKAAAALNIDDPRMMKRGSTYKPLPPQSTQGMREARSEKLPARSEAFQKSVAAYYGKGRSFRMMIVTDKPLYKPGETIWIRSVEVRIKGNATRSVREPAIYELVNPRGIVVKRKKALVEKGHSHNQFKLSRRAVGGPYTIRIRNLYSKAKSSKKITVNNYQPPRIKKKLEFLRKGYGAGDTVEATLKLHRATGGVLASQQVWLVARLKGKVFKRWSQRSDSKGELSVSFKLPAKITSDDGSLTAKITDAGVTESISRPIPLLLKTLKVGFFPEGGKAVVGLPSRVYFSIRKKLDQKPQDIEGVIKDKAGKVVTRVRSFHDGMGRFIYTPKAGKQYALTITRPLGFDKIYVLPAAQTKGITMQMVDDFQSKRPDLRVLVHSQKARSVVLAALQYETLVGQKAFKLTKGKQLLSLPLSHQWRGIVRLTVFDTEYQPLAERLVFRSRGKGLKISIHANQKSYQPRNDVHLKIKVKDPSGKAIPQARLGLSVVDDTVLSFADDHEPHFLSQRFLTTQLVGKIHKPNYYFNAKKTKAWRGLDLVMGTHGWRKFSWRQVATAAKPRTLRALSMYGYRSYKRSRYRRRWRRRRWRRRRVRRKARRRARRRRGGRRWARRAPRARKKGLDNLLGGARVHRRLLRRSPRAPMAPPARVARRAPAPPPPVAPAPPPRLGATPTPVPRARPAPLMIPQARPPVAARRVHRRRRRPPRRRLRRRLADPPRPAKPHKDLAPRGGGGRAAGLRWRRQGQAMGGRKAGENAKKLVKKKAKRRRIRWKRRRPRRIWRRTRRIRARWSYARVFPTKFYKPARFVKGTRTDFRDTVYWNPSVVTDEWGEAKVKFGLNDKITSFRVLVTGLGKGLLGRHSKVIASKRPFFMVVKMPLEVSAGDAMALPLTLRNDTKKALDLKVKARMSRRFKLLEDPLPRGLKLAAGEARTYFYPVRVVSRRGRGFIAFRAEAEGVSDSFRRVIRIKARGFPRERTWAGTFKGATTKTFALVLPKDIRNAAPRASVTLYPNPMSSMIQGLASMIREPYGCFEQASSSNYPNVMIISYLKSRGIKNAAVMRRAYGTLNRGYQKLVGFESPSRGYEWFGKSPGHEALTAYGLLQFTEMRRIYPRVSRTMIHRTSHWLMQRRDGRGGFRRSGQALDSFGRAASHITNAYITFALAEAGRRDLRKELAALEDKAYGSKDPYFVALVLNAIIKVRGSRSDAVRRLRRKLLRMQGKDGAFRGTSHSITRSYGRNLHIETTALSILAMLRSRASLSKTVAALRWLRRQRSRYGGFGTTQATILALRAIIEYDKAHRSAKAPGKLLLAVNRKQRAHKAFTSSRLKALKLKRFARYFVPGKNKIRLRFDSKSTMPYSVGVRYYTQKPVSHRKVAVSLTTKLDKKKAKMGSIVRLTATLTNKTDKGVPMTLARISFPGALRFQSWQLKALLDKKIVDFYETNAREVIVYFRALAPGATKVIHLDLVARVTGNYTGSASSAYLYYTNDKKHWADPLRISVTP